MTGLVTGFVVGAIVGAAPVLATGALVVGVGMIWGTVISEAIQMSYGQLCVDQADNFAGNALGGLIGGWGGSRFGANIGRFMPGSRTSSLPDYGPFDQTHGNSLDNPYQNVGYTLRDRGTGAVQKYGTTVDQDGRYSQEYLDQENVDLQVETDGSTRDMRGWERSNILQYMRDHGGQRPRLNKCNH